MYLYLYSGTFMIRMKYVIYIRKYKWCFTCLVTKELNEVSLFVKKWVFKLPERSVTSNKRTDVFLYVRYKFLRDILAQYLMYLIENFWVHKWDYDIHHLIQYLDNRESIDVADWLAIRIPCILTLPRENVIISLLNDRYWLLCWDKINQLGVLGQNTTQLAVFLLDQI